MQKYSVNLTEDAENDIAELMAFYEELVDTESAMKFFDEAMETSELILVLVPITPFSSKRYIIIPLRGNSAL